MKNYSEAIAVVRQAIEYRPNDDTLFHMLGMCYRSQVFDLLEKAGLSNEVVSLAKLASAAFEEARKIQPDSEYGYISEAQMIVKVLDYSRRRQDVPSVADLERTEPWIREGLQRAEDLLLHVRQRRVGEQPSVHEERCRADLDLLYGNHGVALNRWQNLLDKRDPQGRGVVYAPPIRRQIVWTHLARARRRWDLMDARSVKRVLELLEQNLLEEPFDDRNVRLWIQGSRFLSSPPTIESATEKVAYWRSNSPDGSLDAMYYLFVLYAVQSIGGSKLATDRAIRASEEVRARARYRRDRVRSFEWLGKGDGLRQLIHQDMLGEWNAKFDFWDKSAALRRVDGVVTQINNPGAGEITVPGGLPAFFVPGKADIVLGRDLNARVSMYLGFSYEGLRAWSVQKA